MRNGLLIAVSALVVCGAAWAADVVADGGSAKTPALAAPVPNDQSTLEL